MPKINVYLPEDLADAVRDTGVPVSAICQRALELAVRRVTAIRQTVLTGVAADDLATRLPQFTARAQTALQLAIERAREQDAAHVGTGQLLGGLLAEGGNLGLQILRAMEVQPEQLARLLDSRPDTEPGTAGDGPAARFSDPAADALELAVTEAAVLGHNYVGCEHLLLGLAAEPHGVAGQLLRSVGAEPRAARRAVSAALAGYSHLRVAQSSGAAAPADAAATVRAAVRQELEPVIARIERLERRIGADDPR